MMGRDDEVFQVFGTKTECKCPRCGKKHELIMNWIGRGVPRVYCRPCMLLVGQHENEENQRPVIFDGTKHMAMS